MKSILVVGGQDILAPICANIWQGMVNLISSYPLEIARNQSVLNSNFMQR